MWLLVAGVLLPASAVSEQKYRLIEPPRLFHAEPGKIEVVEFFWYGCPHCYRLEPYLQEWDARQPQDVVFRRIPAVLGKDWVPHARAYYITEILGVVEQTHVSLFDRIHKENITTDKRQSLRAFLASHGVPEADFDRLYESEEVKKKIQRSHLLARRIGVTGVPVVMVNGKYLLSGSITGSQEQIIAEIDELIVIERERQAAEATGAP